MTEPRKIYPSSAAFTVGQQVKTTSNKSCIRFMAAQAFSGLTREQLSTVIAPEYQAIGHIDEWRYSAMLDKQGIKYEREVPFKIEYKGIVISGRMDFVLEDGTIVEKKSTTSANVYKRVFEQGTPEPSHVAQLVSYLAFLNKPKGQLVVSYYEMEKDFQGFQLVEEKVFTVETGPENVILLDGTPYHHSVKDLARFYSLAEQVLSKNVSEGLAGHKPCQPVSKFESPCNFCPLKKICEENDDLAPVLHSLVVPALLDKPQPRSFTMLINTDRRKKNREEKVLARKKV